MIYEHMLKSIREGAYRPGDRIPTEDALQETFQSSRITVSRALRDLERDGYLTRRRGAGTFVRTKDRWQAILEHIGRKGACSYGELSSALGVSPATIRRDVDELAKQGLVVKTLGGAQVNGAPAHFYETTLDSRFPERRREKMAIAECAAKLVAAGHVIYLDGSTTCVALARKLGQDFSGLTILTNSLPAASEAGRNGRNEVLLQGGQYHPESACCVGPACEEAISGFFVETAFMSTRGFLPEEGTFESSISTFRIKQMVADRCRHLCLLVDHSKFGIRALCKVLDTTRISSVVTDEGTSPEHVATLRAMGKPVHVASMAHATKNEGDYDVTEA
jgi:DeoR/GlpR family transcriptional regulator of sugar metabolism